MLNPSNPKEVVFPHSFPAVPLGGKLYDWNDVTGGAAPVEQFGFQKKNFMGGRCIKFGFITELGIYGCLDHFDKKHIRLCGFYIHDPKKITEKGKAVIEQAFPMYHFKYIDIAEVPQKKKESDTQRNKLVEQARELGVSENAVKNAKVESIKSMIEAKKFDIANSKIEDDDFLLSEVAEPKKSTRKVKA